MIRCNVLLSVCDDYVAVLYAPMLKRFRRDNSDSSCNFFGILSHYKVVMANVLANNGLFTHAADPRQLFKLVMSFSIYSFSFLALLLFPALLHRKISVSFNVFDSFDHLVCLFDVCCAVDVGLWEWRTIKPLTPWNFICIQIDCVGKNLTTGRITVCTQAMFFFSSDLTATCTVFIRLKSKGRWSMWMAGVRDAGLWHQRWGFAFWLLHKQ